MTPALALAYLAMVDVEPSGGAAEKERRAATIGCAASKNKALGIQTSLTPPFLRKSEMSERKEKSETSGRRIQ